MVSMQYNLRSLCVLLLLLPAAGGGFFCTCVCMCLYVNLYKCMGMYMCLCMLCINVCLYVCVYGLVCTVSISMCRRMYLCRGDDKYVCLLYCVCKELYSISVKHHNNTKCIL
eukprot:GHVQ01001341.1.p1 GENE.GHVQ01001341.1~~GHVQ01001341.1.p1  ORF type:complete len:112 (-),score=17.49 GHVQ01001341.1:136-471(-)